MQCTWLRLREENVSCCVHPLGKHIQQHAPFPLCAIAMPLSIHSYDSVTFLPSTHSVGASLPIKLTHVWRYKIVGIRLNILFFKGITNALPFQGKFF